MVDREKEILFEVSPFSVRKSKHKGQTVYAVFKDGITAATSEIAYADLSVAILDCAYKGGRKMRGKEAVEIANEILKK